MPARHDDLFGRIASFQALRTAARKAIKGKRKKPGAARFMANFEPEVLRLERDLRDGSYRPGGYVEIGNLTSQFFANLYLDGFDHWVSEVLGAPYVRYVDDFALFHDDPAVLAGWRDRIARYLEGRRLRLHPRKTAILPTAAPAPFLGFILMPGGRRLPDDNVARFRGRLRGMRDRWRAGTIEAEDVEARVGAWVAHAVHADTWRLRQDLLGGSGRRPPWLDQR